MTWVKGQPRPLTPRQRKFIAWYCKLGNGTRAAEKAGYSGDDNNLSSTACELLRNPRIRAAIDAMAESDPGIADRRERLQFWSHMMRERTESARDRIRASEVLAKVFRDFDEMPTEGKRNEIDLTRLSQAEFDEYCRLTKIATGNSTPEISPSQAAADDVIIHPIGVSDDSKEEPSTIPPSQAPRESTK